MCVCIRGHKTPCVVWAVFEMTVTLHRVELRRVKRKACVRCSSSGGDGVSSSAKAQERYGKVGIGTWSWGNKFLWNYNEDKDAVIEEALHEAVRGGVRLVDTADSYGTGALEGRAEMLLGKALRSCSNQEASANVCVATKLAPYPWRITRTSVVDAARKSLARLGDARERIDCAQLHWSTANYAPWQERALWDGIADACEAGLVDSVGLSNYGPKQLRRAVTYLRDERGVKVALAQAQIGLLSREPLKPGNLKDVCDDLGVVLLGYSPLALGLLSGKYDEHGAKLPSGPRALLFRRLLPKIAPLLVALRDVASRTGQSVAQVAIAYVSTKGIIPIVGCNTVEQAKQNVAITDLDDDDIRILDAAADTSTGAMVQNIFNTS